MFTSTREHRFVPACGVPTVAALLILLALAGCGGGGGGDETPSPVGNPPSTPPPVSPPTPPPMPPPPLSAPTITLQTTDQTVLEGMTATFAVGADGAAPLSYQWHRNGQPIAGATASNYITYPLSAADSGTQWSVVVSNSEGQVVSTPALLTVLSPPSITQQPTSQEVLVGESATFVVAASGTAPFEYDWMRNGVLIAGATGPSYSTPPTQLSDSNAAYQVFVRNSHGIATSTRVFLTVREPPPELVDQHIDPTVQSYLVALASGARQTGQQFIPPSGASHITLGSWASPGSLPIRYDATFQLDELEHHRFYGPLSLNPMEIQLNRHVQGAVAGYQLDRYDGAQEGLSTAYGSNQLAMDVLVAPRSGFQFVGIGNWKFIGLEQRGYYSGFPQARGAFILGEPAPSAAVGSATSGEYRGFAHGGLEFYLLDLDRFEEFSSQATAQYDATTRELTLTLSGFEIYGGSINPTALSSTWPQPLDPTTTILGTGITMTCVATVDTNTNEVTCPLSLYGGTDGTFKGKFYGPDAQELAGTFSLVSTIRASFYDGMAGAIALKR